MVIESRRHRVRVTRVWIIKRLGSGLRRVTTAHLADARIRAQHRGALRACTCTPQCLVAAWQAVPLPLDMPAASIFSRRRSKGLYLATCCAVDNGARPG